MQGVANAAYLEGFPFPALLRVAPYCAHGGVRVVSNDRGLRVAGSPALDRQVAMGMAYLQPVAFTLDYPVRWALGISMPYSAATSTILPMSG